MKLINKIYGIAILIIGSLASCSSEDVEQIPDKSAKKELPTRYEFALSIKVPNSMSGTRSETLTGGNSGEEVEGEINECAVNRAFMYFCVDNDVKLTLEAREYKEITNGYDLKAEVDVEDLRELVGNEVAVYILANPITVSNQTIKTAGADKAIFSVADVEAAPIGDFGSSGKIMPMINQSSLKLDLRNISPDTEDEEMIEKIFALFGDDNTYDFGTVDMERTVARIEFKDKARSDGSKPYTYKIGNSAVSMKLDHLQIFNVNTSSYLIRHTTAGNQTEATGDAEAAATGYKSLFGVENNNTGSDGSYRWIAGSDWSYSGGKFNKNKNYLNQLTVTGEGEDAVFSISDGVGASEDGIVSINELDTRSNIENDGYHPWCYVTENVIPSTSLMDDDNLISYATGLACSFVILGTDGNPLEYSQTAANYPENISNTGKENEIVVTMYEDGGVYQEITPVGKYYYLTYYGFIKHHKTGDDIMAPMKYGVVRNNTYQLSVSEISTLPQPNEPKTYFLKLDVEVRPWTVRKNGFVL